MKILLSGENGPIEAVYHSSKENNRKIAIVFHDHPLTGASMNDKATYTLFHTFAENGFNVIRTNYRSVGTSRGPFTNGDGEICDGANILDWMQKNNEMSEEVWISGIGFGAWICFQLLMRRPDITNFVTVSPAIKKYDYSFVNSAPCTGLVINNQISDDVKDDYTKNFVQLINKSELSKKTSYKLIKNCDDKYTNHLKDLYEIMSLFIMKNTHKYD